MKKLIQGWIVVTLEDACDRIDGLPDWTWRIPLLHRLGCPRGMAVWSERLDRHWDTGIWGQEAHDALE